MRRLSLAVAVTTACLLLSTGALASGAASPKGRDRVMAAVVRAWSARLDAGDDVALARLFAIPATVIQAPFVYRLTSRHAVAAWHAGLPCAGSIVSISYRGDVATAVFRLGQRAKRHSCTSPGALAAARFEIVAGKIVLWEQVAVPAAVPAGNVA